MLCTVPVASIRVPGRRPVSVRIRRLDSEYAANAIQGTSQVHKNAVLIEKGKQLYLEEARRRAGGFSFTHVPSHCKIPGNERADELAA